MTPNARVARDDNLESLESANSEVKLTADHRFMLRRAWELGATWAVEQSHELMAIELEA